MKNLYYLLPLLLLVSCQKDELKSTFSISGTVGFGNLSEIELGGFDIPQIKIDLLENDQKISTQTGNEFSFTNLEENKTYTVIPYVEEKNGEGVSTIDLVLVRMFVEGSGSLNVFQQIAADVDKNNIVDQSDLDLLQTCLLQYECFTYRFVSPDYTGTGTAYIDQYVVEDLSADHVAYFRPIKIGDVNHSF